VVVRGEVPAGATVVGVPARALPRLKKVEKAAPAKRRKGGGGR
jgi:serine acetyltransferase